MINRIRQHYEHDGQTGPPGGNGCQIIKVGSHGPPETLWRRAGGWLWTAIQLGWLAVGVAALVWVTGVILGFGLRFAWGLS